MMMKLKWQEKIVSEIVTNTQSCDSFLRWGKKASPSLDINYLRLNLSKHFNVKLCKSGGGYARAV